MNQDELKLAVAQAAIDLVIPSLTSATVIGIGTGSTANFFIDLLAPYREQFRGAVASSNATAERLKAHQIAVFELNQLEEIRFYIDGADETTADLILIKGGGAALTREKIVAAAADQFICIADQSKWVKRLGHFPLPVEVIPMARNFVSRQLQTLGGTPIYREHVVTDNGGHILDVHNLLIDSPTEMETLINQIAGVITNGLFALRPADILLLGTPDGVQTHRRR